MSVFSLYLYNATTGSAPETEAEAQLILPPTLACDQDLGVALFSGPSTFPEDPQVNITISPNIGEDTFQPPFTLEENSSTRIIGIVDASDLIPIRESAVQTGTVQASATIQDFGASLGTKPFQYVCAPPPPPLAPILTFTPTIPICNEEFTLSLEGEVPLGTEITYELSVFTFGGPSMFVPINRVPVLVSESNPTGSYSFLYDLDVGSGFQATEYRALDGEGNVLATTTLNVAGGLLCDPITTTIIPANPCPNDEIDIVTGNFPGEGNGTLFTYYFDQSGLVEEETCQQTVEESEITDTCPSIVVSEATLGVIQVYYGDDGFFSARSTIITLGTDCGGTGGDPHAVCLDNSRIDLYEEGYYRLFDNLSDSTQEPVIMNAQVVRDPFTKEDQYRKVWITLLEKDFALEFYPTYLRLRERKRGERTYTEVGKEKEWSSTYSSSTGEEYLFQADLPQHTVALQIKGERSGFLNGLLSGRIIPISRLEDCAHYAPIVEPLPTQKYKYNALLCGSAQPHITSFQKNYLPTRQGLYRLVEEEGLTLNVELDERGALSKVFLMRGHEREEWIYSGPFWALGALRNGKLVSTHTLTEHRTEAYLLRIQGNGSISFASQKKMKGLLNGEVVVISSLEDCTPREVSQRLLSQSVRGDSLYHRLIEVRAS